MDGIHDVGGMDGFGPLVVDGADDGGDADGYEPFHDRWEGIAYSLFVATLGNGLANIDEFRHSIERMDPDRYLQASYYDRWVTGLARLLCESGTIDFEDFRARTATFEAGEGTAPERVEPGLVADLAAGVAEAYGFEHDGNEPRFAIGEAVRVRNHCPAGHTRCPRYARRARGVVEARRGTYALPDANAHGESIAEPLYEVAFDGQELWGEEGDPNVRVTLDLWESYLDPASSEIDAGSGSDD
jgi:nitrile hydratase